MTAPVPSSCETCAGTGLMPRRPDESDPVDRFYNLTLAGRFCVMCRCHCGRPAVAIGAMCEAHEHEMTAAERSPR